MAPAGVSTAGFFLNIAAKSALERGPAAFCPALAVGLVATAFPRSARGSPIRRGLRVGSVLSAVSSCFFLRCCSACSFFACSARMASARLEAETLRRRPLTTKPPVAPSWSASPSPVRSAPVVHAEHGRQ